MISFFKNLVYNIMPLIKLNQNKSSPYLVIFHCLFIFFYCMRFLIFHGMPEIFKQLV